MPDNKSPMKHVWMVEEVPQARDGAGAREPRTLWTKIGVAYDNADGSLTVQLAAVPVNGKMLIRAATPLPLVAGAASTERAR